jgi:hypothetical protein
MLSSIYSNGRFETACGYLCFHLRKKTNRKLIIIESDDWGLERALSEKALCWMKERFGESNFTRWSTDALETREDLELLYNVLEDFKPKFDLPPVITANFITHNVDYSSPHELKFLPITEGFNEQSEDVRHFYKVGIEKRYIYPQLHGYSHYNISQLEKYFVTREGRAAFQKTFLYARSTIRGNTSFLHGELDRSNEEVGRLLEGIDVFERMFGYHPVSFIAPTFILDTCFLDSLRDNRIQILQAGNRLVNSRKKRLFYPPLRKRNGLLWSIRNVRLDPHRDYGFDAQKAVADIDRAFENNLPAVIDFHRVNFSGKYNPSYRNETISQLRSLLHSIYKKWPEASFLTSDQLKEALAS